MAGSSAYGGQEGALDCRTVHAALRRGELPHGEPGLGEAVEAHLAVCPACAVLIADDAALGRRLAAVPPPDPSPALLADLQASLAREVGLRARLRRLPTPARASLALAVAAALVGLTFALAARPDLAVYPVDRMVLVLVALAGVALGGLALLARPLHRAPAPDGARRVVVGLAVAVPGLVASLPPAHAAHAASAIPPELLLPSIVACFTFGSVVALVLAGALRLLDRRSRVDPTFATLAVVVGGVVGNLALQLHCPATSPAHLLPGHAGVGLVLGAAVALLGLRRR